MVHSPFSREWLFVLWQMDAEPHKILRCRMITLLHHLSNSKHKLLPSIFSFIHKCKSTLSHFQPLSHTEYSDMTINSSKYVKLNQAGAYYLAKIPVHGSDRSILLSCITQPPTLCLPTWLTQLKIKAVCCSKILVPYCQLHIKNTV